ncbi:hypothetical protein FEZ18_02140 [Oceanihabitans sp. IOP_32]|uniref:hypothetical protein n=1 Tax=Oceanihabitans sp. IOP_32 TaxID=2529032 RepID=UPI001293F3C3|nr:hypothetical protein [Oceanihabitans sp. IOP_32]QFZ53686.1 hypothetical protein FEZ18_02140 [Oceanihabitans sp. IOP_32]
MIHLKIKDKSHKFVLRQGVLTGSCILDENWRNMDYKNVDSVLRFSVLLSYEMLLEDTDAIIFGGTG